MGRLREVKDSLRARRSLNCMRGGLGRLSIRGSRMDQYSLRAHVKRDEVSYTVVPRATANGDVCMCGGPGWHGGKW